MKKSKITTDSSLKNDLCDGLSTSDSSQRTSADASKRRPEGIVRRLPDFFVCAAQAACLAVLAVISGLALCVTIRYPFEEGHIYSERQDFTTFLSPNGLWELSAGILCTLILVTLLFVIWKTRLGSTRPQILLLIIMLFVFIFQILWIISLNTKVFVFPDTLQLMDAAKQFSQGNYAAFHGSSDVSLKTGADLYLSLYPFQSGMLLFFSSLYSIFGEYSYIIVQVINAIANTLVLLCLYVLVNNLTSRRKSLNLCLLLCAACFPLLFSCVLVYGNSLGLLLSCAALAFLSCTLGCSGARRAVLLIASFLAIGIAIIVKSTCILYLIPMGIFMAVVCLRSRNWKLALGVAVCVVLTSQLPGLAASYVSQRTGADLGAGMPKTSWVAMGLRDDNPLDMPGWWGFYPYSLYLEAEGDGAQQNQEAIDSIRQSVSSFISDPTYGIHFFGVKLASEWADPSFQSLYYSSLSETDLNGKRDYGRLATTVLYGNANKSLLLWMEGYQLLIYLFAVIYCLRLIRSKQRSIRSILIPATIAVGFIVYLFWEAKSVYLLPFFIVMIPLAAIEVDHTLCRIEAVLGKSTALGNPAENSSRPQSSSVVASIINRGRSLLSR